MDFFFQTSNSQRFGEYSSKTRAHFYFEFRGGQETRVLGPPFLPRPPSEMPFEGLRGKRGILGKKGEVNIKGGTLRFA